MWSPRHTRCQTHGGVHLTYLYLVKNVHHQKKKPKRYVLNKKRNKKKLIVNISLKSKNEVEIFVLNICISPNVGRYYGLVTGPPPAMEATMEAMEAMEAAAATERF